MHVTSYLPTSPPSPACSSAGKPNYTDSPSSRSVCLSCPFFDTGSGNPLPLFREPFPESRRRACPERNHRHTLSATYEPRYRTASCESSRLHRGTGDPIPSCILSRSSLRPPLNSHHAHAGLRPMRKIRFTVSLQKRHASGRACVHHHVRRVSQCEK